MKKTASQFVNVEVSKLILSHAVSLPPPPASEGGAVAAEPVRPGPGGHDGDGLQSHGAPEGGAEPAAGAAPRRPVSRTATGRATSPPERPLVC